MKPFNRPPYIEQRQNDLPKLPNIDQTFINNENILIAESSLKIHKIKYNRTEMTTLM